MKKRALITGITGQDGIFLSQFLLEKGYDVYGMDRRKSHLDRNRLDEIRSFAKTNGLTFELVYGDIEDSGNMHKMLSMVQPDEIYNFASQSHVHLSYEEPELTTRVNANGVLAILEAAKLLVSKCKFYQACSSELFGDPLEVPQTEKTFFCPKNPYAISKLYSFWMAKFFRDYHKMFVCNGILFNHESDLRGENFVTRKITYSFARIKAGLQERLLLGNYDSRRDWGFAGDYVEAMWLMLQQEKPDDYLISTGETHSVREFVEIAAKISGFDLEWKGKGIDEVAIDKNTKKTIVAIDPKFYRASEKNILVGDSSKAKKILGWSPKVNFEKLVETMMIEDLKRFNLIK